MMDIWSPMTTELKHPQQHHLPPPPPLRVIPTPSIRVSRPNYHPLLQSPIPAPPHPLPHHSYCTHNVNHSSLISTKTKEILKVSETGEKQVRSGERGGWWEVEGGRKGEGQGASVVFERYAL